MANGLTTIWLPLCDASGAAAQTQSVSPSLATLSPPLAEGAMVLRQLLLGRPDHVSCPNCGQLFGGKVKQLFMLDLSCITRREVGGDRRQNKGNQLKEQRKMYVKRERENEKAAKNATQPEGDNHNGNFASFKWRQGRRKTGKTERKMLKRRQG